MNVFAEQQALLREQLQSLLATLHPALRADVVFALEEESKLLAPQTSEASALPAGVWPLLTILVIQHLAPESDRVSAGRVGVAVECLVRAIDLIDDIIDGDQSPTVQALGTARTVNVATGLFILAQQAILSLAQREVSEGQILRLLAVLQEGSIATTAGQHLDILAEARPEGECTREECLELAALKAGSLMSLTCRLGAIYAQASEEECAQFSELGRLLGIAHQLDNDCHDLYHLLQDQTFTGIRSVTTTTALNQKTDLLRGKKTLPIVFAQHVSPSLQESLLLVGEEKKASLRGLHEGCIAAWGICLLYRERAHMCLQGIEARRPVAPALRLLLGFV